MTAAVAPLPQLHEPQDASALARKRRREILMSQRAAVVPDAAISLEISAPKRRKVDPEAATTTKTSVAAKKRGPKKPQMKYDPDVPMTKEEAAVWRREQRRKRNRESAAASRQRQRDRIAELEVELDDWKDKYNEIMKKIHEMEELARMKVTDELIDSLPTTGFVSPKSPVRISPCDTPVTSPVVSRSYDDIGKVSADEESDAAEESNEDEAPHSNKMISRQAKS